MVWGAAQAVKKINGPEKKGRHECRPFIVCLEQAGVISR
jgi:hypothetical protein